MKKITLLASAAIFLASCSSISNDDFKKLVEGENTTEVIKAIPKLDKETKFEALGQALYIATNKGSIKLAEALLDNGANPMWKTFEGKNVLNITAQKGYINLAKKIIEKDSETTEELDQTGSSALQYAIANGQSEIALAILNGGSSPINYKSLAFECPLFLAAKAGELEVIKKLLDKGADVNYRNDGEPTAIYGALQGGNTEIIQLLLDNGADTSLKAMYADNVYDIISWCNSSIHGVSSEAREYILSKLEQ